MSHPPSNEDPFFTPLPDGTPVDPFAQTRADNPAQGKPAEARETRPSPTPITAAPADHAAVAERIGDKIGPYKLLQQIGEGGCGVVFMAEQEKPIRRRVALKVIKLGMDTKSVVARFEAERQALALMDHPNIAKVLDVGATAAGRPYFVMELVRGIRITDYCNQAKLTTPQRLELFTRVCAAIQHAHQRGIIHRDIKPSNILVTLHDGVPVPKVIDFGIAKATNSVQLTDKTLFTALEQMIGTPAYMSPEQAEMSGLDIDTRTDIYSLGVLLYELLTDRLPFDPKELLSAGFDAMRRKIREDEPDRPSTRMSTLVDAEISIVANERQTNPRQLARSLQGDLDWIVMKALEKDRQRRYESASAFAEDIRRYLANDTILALPPSTLYLLQKLVRRHQIAFAAGSAILLSLLIGITLSTRMYFQEKDARQRAVQAEIAAAQAATAAKRDRDQAIAEKLRADEQSEISRAVTYFVTADLLRLADAEKQIDKGFAPQPDLTVRDALRRAAGKVGTRFADRPLVEAEVLAAIGRAMQGIGESRAAVPHLERALELHRKFAGTDHTNTLRSMFNLALTYREAGRLDESLALHEQTLKLRRLKLGLDHHETLTSMANVALAYRSLNRFAEALALQQEALKIRTTALGPDHQQTLISMSLVATGYRDLGRFSEAVTLGEDILRRMQSVLGPDHPNTLFSMSDLAASYASVGRKAEALELRQETLRTRSAKLGADHPQTLSSMNDLAAAYRDLGRIDEAIPMAEEALKLRKTKLGLDHPHTWASMANLASTYRAAGRAKDALALDEESAAQISAKFGRDHADTLKSKNSLAQAYLADGQREKSLSLLAEILKVRTSQPGTAQPETIKAMFALATGYLDGGRPADAEPLLRQLISLLKEHHPADWQRFHAESLLGAALTTQNKFPEAGQFLLSGYSGLVASSAKIPKQKSSPIAGAITRLVKLAEAKNDPSAAAQWKKTLAEFNSGALPPPPDSALQTPPDPKRN